MNTLSKSSVFEKEGNWEDLKGPWGLFNCLDFGVLKLFELLKLTCDLNEPFSLQSTKYSSNFSIPLEMCSGFERETERRFPDLPTKNRVRSLIRLVKNQLKVTPKDLSKFKSGFDGVTRRDVGMHSLEFPSSTKIVRTQGKSAEQISVDKTTKLFLLAYIHTNYSWFGLRWVCRNTRAKTREVLEFEQILMFHSRNLDK